MFLLIDCNNFFVSCEQLARPALRDKPVVVLSSVGGIVLARSKEAKALGIPMGAPAFKYQNLFLSKNVITLSANFSLYERLSNEVMDVLESYGFKMEIYSVDEAFLKIDLSNDYLALGTHIRNKIQECVGITVSVGIAATKTLAKVANHLAKGGPGVCFIPDSAAAEKILSTFPLAEVWGIGPRTAETLRSFSLHYALDLLKKPDEWIKKQLSIIGLRTVFELRGTPCLTIDDQAPQKSIVRSRSFAARIGTLEKLEEAVASHASSVAKNLRKQKLKTHNLSVFLYSGHYISEHITLPEATSYTPLLISKAKECLNNLYQKGKLYKKAGVMAYELTHESENQKDFFNPTPSENGPLMHTLDLINRRFGKKILYFAAEGIPEE